jgi:hypothetical protein
MPVNIIALRKEIERQSGKLVTPKIAPLFNKQFAEAKKQMLKDFDNHPVTEEILAGPELQNSQFVDTSHGGNLFSFLGFDEGENPVEDLREILDEETVKGSIEQTIGNDSIKYKMEVSVPNMDDIKSQTQNLSRWSTRSWVDAIQRGIRGFPSYLFNALGFKGSASGTAIEAKNKKTGSTVNVRGGSFKGVKYLSTILQDFKDNIRSRNL